MLGLGVGEGGGDVIRKKSLRVVQLYKVRWGEASGTIFVCGSAQCELVMFRLYSGLSHRLLYDRVECTYIYFVFQGNI